jgi:chromosome segregation ATPase
MSVNTLNVHEIARTCALALKPLVPLLELVPKLEAIGELDNLTAEAASRMAGMRNSELELADAHAQHLAARSAEAAAIVQQADAARETLGDLQRQIAKAQRDLTIANSEVEVARSTQAEVQTAVADLRARFGAA